jgi:succinyl-diaminopimelate desuccinylase
LIALGDIAAFVLDEAGMLADLVALTPEPTALPTMVTALGYTARELGTGIFAAGDTALPTLLFPLYRRAGLSVLKRDLVGRQITRSGSIVAGLAALRDLALRPSLLFLYDEQPLPTGILEEHVVSLEGGVVPKIWRQCYGTFDALVRVVGHPSHPGLSNTGVNAVEAAVPLMQALLHLKTDVSLRSVQRGHGQDAPLQPRLTISALHGGSRGSVLPTVLDILVSRRYAPEEDPAAALEEISAVIGKSIPGSVRAEIAMTLHEPPVADPDEARRNRIERALASGWGWPQVPFLKSSKLVPGATILGGLEKPDRDDDTDAASTTLDDMAALARTIRALLLDQI